MQVRVLEPLDTLHAALLIARGMRYCTKDSRWEKNFRNRSNAQSFSEDLKSHNPHIKVELEVAHE
jgi:hypothetical protein